RAGESGRQLPGCRRLWPSRAEQTQARVLRTQLRRVRRRRRECAQRSAICSQAGGWLDEDHHAGRSTAPVTVRQHNRVVSASAAAAWSRRGGLWLPPLDFVRRSQYMYVNDGSAVALTRRPLPRTTATKVSPASTGAGTV